jgi:phosphatidate cytidylyltransferase
MKRLLTAAVGVPIVLAALFYLPGVAFFLFIAVLFDWAALEYVEIVRPHAPHAPLALLLGCVPLVAAGLAWVLSPGTSVVPAPPALLTPSLALLATCLLASVGFGALVLFARVPLPETIASLGILGFGTPYFALPIASLSLLQRIDPWLVFLLMAIVWLGDSAAYYAGSQLGKHRMAPTISPKKSWEGAAAGFVTSLLAAAVWSVCRLGRLSPGLLALAALTAVAAQVGDLVESMVKRGSGVKDSGRVLPGHGGVLDRVDAMLFAAPVLYAGVLLGVVP